MNRNRNSMRSRIANLRKEYEMPYELRAETEPIFLEDQIPFQRIPIVAEEFEVVALDPPITRPIEITPPATEIPETPDTDVETIMKETDSALPKKKSKIPTWLIVAGIILGVFIIKQMFANNGNNTHFYAGGAKTA